MCIYAVIAELHGVYKNAIVLIVLSEEFLAQPTILHTFSAEGFALQCYSLCQSSQLAMIKEGWEEIIFS